MKISMTRFRLKLYSLGVFLILMTALAPAVFPYRAEIGMAEADFRFFSGETVDRSLIIEKLPPRAEADCGWAALVETAVLEKGSAAAERSGKRRARAAVTLRLPEVERRIELSWAVAAWAGGERLAENVFTFRIFPRKTAADLRNLLRRKRIGLFDPRGTVKTLFIKLGISYSEISTDLSILFFQGDAVIIGPGALTDSRREIFRLLRDNTGIGGGIFCLGQEAFPPDSPARAVGGPISRTEEPVITAGRHSIFSGLSPGDFRNWRGEKEPIYPLESSSGGGGSRPLLAAPEEETGYPASLILEDRLGRVPVLFCQLPVCETFSTEPAAGILFVNMMRYVINNRVVLSNNRDYTTKVTRIDIPRNVNRERTRSN